jgi:hypothetical protein
VSQGWGDGFKTGMIRMRSLSANFAIVFLLIGFAVLGGSETSWAEWTLFDKTDDADFYCDIEDIARPSSGIDTVWTKQVYTKKGVEDRVGLFGKNFEQLDHSIDLVELDCLGKLALSLSIVYFSKDGSVLNIKESDNRWQFISSNPIYDALYWKVCR